MPQTTQPTAAPRGLDMTKIAATVTAVVDDLRALHGDERVIEIIQTGKQIGQNILATANASAQDMAEIVGLALEVYESLRGPSRTLGKLKPLDKLDNRPELVYYIRALVSEPDVPDAI